MPQRTLVASAVTQAVKSNETGQCRAQITRSEKGVLAGLRSARVSR